MKTRNCSKAVLTLATVALLLCGSGETASGIMIEYLVVGGGGGGGGGFQGGGGGAGGMLTGSVSVPVGSHTVIVGDGGAGGIGSSIGASNVAATSGDNSSFDYGTIIEAFGGGRGAAEGGQGFNYGALTGGSGGGGSHGGGPGRPNELGAAGTALQGNDGGDALVAFPTEGAGGGGAGGDGDDAAGGSFDPADGGLGLASSITGSPVIYARGGDGSLRGSGFGDGTNGTDGLGNGGNAGENSSANSNGGDGGSGIVILRWLTGQGEIGLGGTQSFINDGGMEYSLHVFDTVGSFSFEVSEVPPVPEPSSLMLLGLGALGLIRHTRRRRK